MCQCEEERAPGAGDFQRACAIHSSFKTNLQTDDDETDNSGCCGFPAGLMPRFDSDPAEIFRRGGISTFYTYWYSYSTFQLSSMRLLSLVTLLCGTVAVSAGGRAAGASTFVMKSKLSANDRTSTPRPIHVAVEDTAGTVPSVRGGAGPFKPSAVAQFATIITILK